MLGTNPVVIVAMLTVLGAVPEAGVAESQLEFRALATDQLNVPPPELVICKFWVKGKEPDCTAVKLNEAGENEITAGVGGAVIT